MVLLLPGIGVKHLPQLRIAGFLGIAGVFLDADFLSGSADPATTSFPSGLTATALNPPPALSIRTGIPLCRPPGEAVTPGPTAEEKGDTTLAGVGADDRADFAHHHFGSPESFLEQLSHQGAGFGGRGAWETFSDLASSLARPCFSTSATLGRASALCGQVRTLGQGHYFYRAHPSCNTGLMRSNVPNPPCTALRPAAFDHNSPRCWIVNT